jgi:hypothetical protein
MPDEATNCQIAVIAADIWNNSPNISSKLGNNTMSIEDSVNGIVSVVIPDGNYDVESLDQMLSVLYSSATNGFGNRLFYPYSQYYRITGNNATQKINIEVYEAPLASQKILWNQSTIRNILGFNSDSPTVPPVLPQVGAPSFMVAPNIAKFNAYNSFVVHSDLVHSGIQLNNNYYNIISLIPITAATGTLNVYSASYPYVFSGVGNLVGQMNARYNANFWLTDEKNIPLTMSENWDIVVQITYDMP